MKKSVLFLCAGALALSLTACGGDSPEESNVSGDGSQGTEQTSSPDNSGEASGEESGTGTSGEESTEEGGDASDNQQGDAGDQDNSYGDGWSQEMAELRAAAVEAVGEENYWPDMPMEPDIFQMFYGITSDMYEDYMAESPMISANVDTLIIVRAKEGQADAVFDMLSTYRENLVNDTMQYPQNLGKIQASQVVKEGDYVIFVQLGGQTPDGEGLSEEEAMSQSIAQCQEANQKVLEAIKDKIVQ